MFKFSRKLKKTFGFHKTIVFVKSAFATKFKIIRPLLHVKIFIRFYILKISSYVLHLDIKITFVQTN